MHHRYHPLPVKRVVTETDDAKSIVFDVPGALAPAFSYTAGQFVTLRLVIDGEPTYRSYSMSSTPAIDAELQVTVKRVPGGLVSNRLLDTVVAGDVLDVSVPAGVFVLADTDDDVVAFAGGSGITPIFSLVKAALHTTDRRVRLLFANRDRGSAIFGDALDGLAARVGGRLVIQHHEDAANGFIGPDDVVAFAGDRPESAFYICGPGGFMDVVETALLGGGVDPGRIHIERFTPTGPVETVAAEAPDESATPITVTITLGNRTETVAQRGDSSILNSARFAGLRAPASCEAGHCATCMAQVVEGRVEMANNEVLTPEEVAEGWVLTCQATPVSTVVRVVYDP